MKNFLQLFVIVFYFSSCGQSDSINHKTSNKEKAILVDTTLIAIIDYDTSFKYLTSFKGYTTFKLSPNDIQNIDSILSIAINNYNLDQEKKFQEAKLAYPNSNIVKSNFFIDLKKYKRQYIVALNNKGEKLVWVNCFCKGNLDYFTKKAPMIVMDGGNCFFNIKINLTTKEYFDFSVNGDA